jgi:hypothetical protein
MLINHHVTPQSLTFVRHCNEGFLHVVLIPEETQVYLSYTHFQPEPCRRGSYNLHSGRAKLVPEYTRLQALDAFDAVLSKWAGGDFYDTHEVLSCNYGDALTFFEMWRLRYFDVMDCLYLSMCSEEFASWDYSFYTRAEVLKRCEDHERRELLKYYDSPGERTCYPDTLSPVLAQVFQLTTPFLAGQRESWRAG